MSVQIRKSLHYWMPLLAKLDDCALNAVVWDFNYFICYSGPKPIFVTAYLTER